MKEYEAMQRVLAERRARCPRAAELADILHEAHDLMLARAYESHRAFTVEETAVLAALLQIENGIVLGIEVAESAAGRVAELLAAAGVGHAFASRIQIKKP